MDCNAPQRARFFREELERHHPFFPTLNLALAERIRREGPFQLGESYVRGEWDFEPLDELMLHVFGAGSAATSPAERLRVFCYLLRSRLCNPQRGRGVFRVAERHYDLGNDLFGVMLDATMSYTCAYWNGAATLEQAQRAKLDLVCRKLALQPGMRVLDIGCGWGNFAAHAAERYGVSVVGVTVSREQACLARERCAHLPVEIQLKDYREVSGLFDCAVSIEMIEAVGMRNLRAFFETAHRSLKPHGLFLVEAISCETVSRCSSACLDQFLMWILRYIFPNGYLPKITELAAPCRDLFVMEDLHSFGQDYDRTLLEWAANFESGWKTLGGRYDESFRRRWRFYLLSCAALFRARLVQLYQIVYCKGGRAGGYAAVR
jgi:cyclopropane-fatty-acyl-phospholipid synthase